MSINNQQYGMNAETGQRLSGIDHLRQSLQRIILTMKLSRVMRRDFGFDDELLDTPGTNNNILKTYAQLANAVDRWEPRFSLTKINVTQNNGHFEFDFKGDYLGNKISIGGIQT